MSHRKRSGVHIKKGFYGFYSKISKTAALKNKKEVLE